MILKSCLLDSWAVGQRAMWAVAMVGGDADGFLALRPVGYRWATAGESAKLPVNSLALQQGSRAWKQMNRVCDCIN